ncbi:hypothetical protein M0R45_029562 [Rubus argutus]|uniref:Uncharacterized protein n=1 Tax=Rubus argutus TaxID=59490 RepID=A0AAW1W863_RUBAR
MGAQRSNLGVQKLKDHGGCAERAEARTCGVGWARAVIDGGVSSVCSGAAGRQSVGSGEKRSSCHGRGEEVSLTRQMKMGAGQQVMER